MIVSSAKAMEAAEVLAVKLENLTAAAITRAFRAKAKDCHPDHHGTDQLQQWARVSWAKAVLTHWLAKHPPEEPEETLPANRGDCRACGGTGRVAVVQRRVGSFSKPLTMACVICKGLGTVIVEEDDGD